MKYEVKGTIDTIHPERTFPSGFTKREFIVVTDGKYPQKLPFSFVKDRIALLNTFGVGQRVKVEFDIRGRETNGRVYVDLFALGITHDGAEADAGGRETHEVPVPAAAGDDGEMPF